MAEQDEQVATEEADAPVVGAVSEEAKAPPASEEGVLSPPAPVAPVSPSLPARPARSAIRARRVRRWRLALGFLLIVGVLGTALYLALPPLPAQPTRPAVVLILPRADGIECARDAEWAPDGKRLAVLGYALGCPDGSSGATIRAGTVLIYNGLTGALLARIQPDAAIAATVGVPAASEIQYRAAIWSPDGQRLAVTFGVASGTTTIEGVYLCNPAGGAVKVMTRTDTNAGVVGMWDLQAGTFLAMDQPPAALGYQWSPGGALVGSGALSPTAAPAAPPLAPIGTPDGGAAFSAWQPGAITVRDVGAAQETPQGGAYVLSTRYAVWSPDGRYLLPNAGMQARLPLADAPAPSQATLTTLGLVNTPLLPVRDRALQLALDRLGALAPDQRGNSPMLVAWSPDGRLLAVQLVPSEMNDVAHIAHHALLIYDCATGKALVALTPDATNTPTEGPTFVRWSPDGARLLLFDNQLGTLTIFGRSKIPGA